MTNSPVTYNGTPQAATVVGSVAGTVSAVLYNGSATVPTNAGTYAITADFVPDDTTNYDSLSGAAAGTFVIDKAATTTTVTCTAGPFTYTGAAIEPCTAAVTGPGGLNQALAVDLCRQRQRRHGHGQLRRYAASANHLASSAAETFTIGKATPTLSVTNSPVTYDGTPQAATVVGSVPGTVSTIRYNGSATVPTNAGTYAITADFAPADTTNYNSLTGAAAGTFVINKAATTTTVTCTAGPFTYTGAAIAPCTATVTGPGGLNQAVAVTYAGQRQRRYGHGQRELRRECKPPGEQRCRDLHHRQGDADAVGDEFAGHLQRDAAGGDCRRLGGRDGQRNILYDGSATVPTNAGTYAVTADFVPDDTRTTTASPAPPPAPSSSPRRRRRRR